MLVTFLKTLLAPGIDPNGEFRGDYYSHEQLVRFASRKAQRMQEAGLDYPAFVHLETQANCNAACTFCPYPTMERKGVRMSDELISKVIGDLSDIPKHVAFQLAPYKVSEPFLEPRLFDILALANERLPNASINIITNGSPLTEKKIRQLGKVKRLSYINVSLNFDNAEDYEAVMKIPFARTVERLDVLHRMHAEGVITCMVRLTRVATSREDDMSFIHWVKANFPRFKPDVAPAHDWIGEVNPSTNAPSVVPDAPCHRWFDMSITATGVVSMCCMDGSAKYPKGDVSRQHALEIYNQPWLRELRRTLVSRRQARAPCNACTYLSY